MTEGSRRSRRCKSVVVLIRTLEEHLGWADMLSLHHTREARRVDRTPRRSGTTTLPPATERQATGVPVPMRGTSSRIEIPILQPPDALSTKPCYTRVSCFPASQAAGARPSPLSGLRGARWWSVSLAGRMARRCYARRRATHGVAPTRRMTVGVTVDHNLPDHPQCIRVDAGASGVTTGTGTESRIVGRRGDWDPLTAPWCPVL
jgi:hypothetical protein